MHHQNVVRMRHAYFVDLKQEPVVFDINNINLNKKTESAQLNIVMDYIPSNVHRIQAHFLKMDQQVHPLLIKLYSYQLLRALNYIQL